MLVLAYSKHKDLIGAGVRAEHDVCACLRLRLQSQQFGFWPLQHDPCHQTASKRLLSGARCLRSYSSRSMQVGYPPRVVRQLTAGVARPMAPQQSAQR